jgi:hypothetical protein
VNNLETGEYGSEDIVNPADSANGVPNNVLDAGEDLNGNGALDTYGATPSAYWLNAARLRANTTTNGTALTVDRRPKDTIKTREARINPSLFFRRALKIVNAAGTAANLNVSPLTLLPTGRGLTIATENPVYVQGNYNTGTAGNFGAAQTDHRPSAIIADSLTWLSSNWNDIRSFTYTNGGATHYGSHDTSQRQAATTWYRAGVVAGKGLSFTRPTWAAQDFGTDGGAHNFLRYIENWGGQTINYRGSIVSFYTSRQGIGTYKCCTNVYSPPTRGYNFDTEFLQLSLIPPKSPAFRDINTLTFRQMLRPTQ